MSNFTFSQIAYAAEALPAAREPQSSMITSLLPLVVIFVVFYFLLIRPQQKKAKQHQELLNNVKKGEKVITNSGIVGTIADIDSEAGFVALEISKDVNILIQKQCISQIMTKEKVKAVVTKSEKKTKAKKTKV